MDKQDENTVPGQGLRGEKNKDQGEASWLMHAI